MKGAEEVVERKRYEICVRKCFYDFSRVVYDRGLENANLETPGPCFEWEGVTRSWKSFNETVGKEEKTCMFAIGEKNRVPRCPLQLASKIKPYTPATDYGTDELLKYVVESKIMKKR